ncbi:hypothetical protein EPUS_09484 [Endocarpon pusillum Z07020]|uniref:Uncharacterized protein n=1 Tax=Endocarpon pusillum (strain Z07020 / HMAS-L-300199) TaxID=1263415 RepID=U1GG75_ENDPU|nr:uncharacterized protein EPUS_09484 [Endocarpon pusillum Z07020]ERF70771.1 hypothetical protein EPUS_09484 [Endocarpon pusillum Z07020]
MVVGSSLWVRERSVYADSSYTGIHTHPKKWVTLEWWSLYSVTHQNQTTAVDAAWEALQPTHGIVAVDSQWADERQLLPSMELPGDTSKRVYILEAYHMLHCLKILRKTFYQILRRESTTFKLQHSNHCFDALRQNIMCNADDTPLYTWNRRTAGDGQPRKCRDWNILRDWASEHKACYRNIDGREGGQFIQCDDEVNADDGLIVESFDKL